MTCSGRVLVVDDDEGIREFVTWVLADEGYEVLAAAHGQAALDLIPNSPPDLILLDVCMPVMDGLEFAQAYRLLPPPRAPIVILSAARNVETLASDIGATACLSKPFDIEALLATVAGHSCQTS